MSSTKNVRAHSPEERTLMLEQARLSIAWGIEKGEVIPLDLDRFPAHMQQQGASFVTLNQAGQLRGCIGSLIAHLPLIVDVSENAFNAALKDPRFPSVAIEELDDLEIHLSILSTPEPLSFRDELDLIGQLKPGIDGLILCAGHHRGTFLPSVWESLPEPTLFLRQLKLKAGLAADYWSENITVERYLTESFH